MLDEPVVGGQRLRAGGREQSRAVVADEGDAVLALPPVEVGTDLVVDLVLDRPPRLRHVEVRLLRRRLAVVVVEVPRAACRLVAVQEQPVTQAGLPVVVLHEQPALAATGGPFGELRLGGAVAALLEELDDRKFIRVVQRSHEAVRTAARRRTDAQGLVDLGERVPVCLGLQEDRLIAQLGGSVPHRGQDQVRLLPMEPPPPEHGLRLNQKHGLVRGVEELGAELVGEEPATSHRAALPRLPPTSHHSAGVSTALSAPPTDETGRGGQIEFGPPRPSAITRPRCTSWCLRFCR
jgi:hypothetical protein